MLRIIVLADIYGNHPWFTPRCGSIWKYKIVPDNLVGRSIQVSSAAG
jgi:hypothetical protein